MFQTKKGWWVLSDKEWGKVIDEGARYKCSRCNLPHTFDEGKQSGWKCHGCGGWLKKIMI